MTNFLIGFPDLQANALRTQTTNVFSDDTPLKNILGRRGLASKLATAATGLKVVEFDSGATDTANHLYLARADRLSNSGVSRVSVRGSDASFFYPTSSLFTSYLDGSRGVTLSNSRVGAWSDQLSLLANFTQATTANCPWWTRADNKEERFRHTTDFTGSGWDASGYPASISGQTMTATAGAARHGVYYTSTQGERKADNVTTLYLTAHLQYVNNQYAWVGESGDGSWRGAIVDLQNGTIANTYNLASSSITARTGGGYILKLSYLTTACTNHAPGVWFSNTSGSSSPPSFTAAGTEQITIHELHLRSTSADDYDLANTTGVSQFRGVNGNRALHVQGTQYMTSTSLLSAIIAAGSGVIYVGYRPSTITTNHMVFNDANTNVEFWVTGSNMRAENNDGGADNISIAAAVGTPTIWRWRHASGTLYFAKDTGSGFGAESSIASGNTTALTGALWLAAYTGPAGYAWGDIFCIATASGSTADATLETMLRARFLTAATTDTFALGSETLIGPRGDDYLEEFTETSAKRYFWVEFDSETTSSTNDLDSLFIGKWFDFSTEPGSWRTTKRYSSGSEMASGGTGDIKRKGDQRYVISVVWNNISNANTKLFMDQAREIYKRKRQFILRSTDPAAILDSKTVIQVEFADLPKSEKTGVDYNIISARFIEALG